MARIKIEDLPVNKPLNHDEAKGVFGGSWSWGAYILPHLEQDNLRSNSLAPNTGGTNTDIVDGSSNTFMVGERDY